MNIIDSIGNTPLVEIKTKLRGRQKVRILAKLEGLNPGGSIKDRPAYFMLKDAAEQGILSGKRTIMEATSGNTGIALAMLGAAMGYKVKLVVPESASRERLSILAALGATVELTPAEKGIDAAIYRVRQQKQAYPEKYLVLNQYDNFQNLRAHYVTTGPEIMAQTEGDIDVFMAGMGTAGTIMGAGGYLKEKNPRIRIIGIEPRIGHAIQGLKNMQEALVPGLYRPEFLDEKIVIDDEEALAATRMLAQKMGILAGLSSGAALAGALRVARRMQTGSIVTVFPDRGDRYLSSNIFRNLKMKTGRGENRRKWPPLGVRNHT